MQQILIITDNPHQAKRFEKEVWPIVSTPHNKLSFYCSPYTSPDQFDLETSIDGIDLRDDESVKGLLKFDLIISIHCMQLFPKSLVDSVRCVNVHPGYNPINRGWYPQVFAIIHGLQIGATIHEIDEHLDHGNIISRAFVEKHSYDTSKTIYDRVLNMEIELLKENIESILTNSYQSEIPEGKGNLYLKKDFNDLCQLDLDKSYRLGDAINLLRALTHGEYKNAYFIDEKGNKVFVSIQLENE